MARWFDAVRTLRGLWSEKTWFDYLLAGFLVIIYGLISQHCSSVDFLSFKDLNQRLAIYSTTASVISIFGGLGAISITVYISASGERWEMIKRNYHVELHRNWVALTAGLGLAALFCVTAQLVDYNKEAGLSQYVFWFGASLAVLRFARLIWIFDHTLEIWSKDTSESGRISAPRFHPKWTENSE
ncbi:hypothetical protein [Streptomonospora alba]|uniref:hypothetical protein n=1 Tax=Streptomonospora alba TaxID=183763 RepID=UPI0012EE73B5|nr:hypothetical protein [Streptomonospora alba]